MSRSFNRLVVALVAVGGLVGSALIGIFAEDGPHVLGLHLLAFIGFALSAVLLIRLFWGVFRSGV